MLNYTCSFDVTRNLVALLLKRRYLKPYFDIIAQSLFKEQKGEATIANIIVINSRRLEID